MELTELLATLMKDYEELVAKQEIVQQDRELIVQKALEAFTDVLKEVDKNLETISYNLATAKDMVTSQVLTSKETYKGKAYMAVWNKGRESWDTSKLAGYAVAHPELLALKSVGEPSVSFRKITKKDE